MSDEHNNITPIFPEEGEKPPKKHRLKNRWLAFILIVLVVIAVVVVILLSNSTALDSLKRFFRYLGVDSHSRTIRFDAYGNSSYAVVDDSFAVASQSGLSVYSEGGSRLLSLSGGFSHPLLVTSDDLALLYDLGGTRFALFDAEGEILFDLTASGRIFDADLCENGTCAVLYEGTDCHAVLELYSRKGAKLYAHRSESAFLNTCALSPDGSLAVVTTLGQEDISFVSGARILPTTKEGVRATFSFAMQVICDVAFLDDETICAIGEDTVFFFDADGKLLCEYENAEAGLAAYRFGNDCLLALYDNYDMSQGYSLVCLSSEGKVTASLRLEEEPTALSVNKRYVCVLTSEGVLIYDTDLNLRSRTENVGYLAALARHDGTALCITSSEAVLFIP